MLLKPFSPSSRVALRRYFSDRNRGLCFPLFLLRLLALCFMLGDKDTFLHGLLGRLIRQRPQVNRADVVGLFGADKTVASKLQKRQKQPYQHKPIGTGVKMRSKLIGPSVCRRCKISI